ncbi:MAG: hypothetical protein QM786_07265 [Breznakibacter sp.]
MQKRYAGERTVSEERHGKWLKMPPSSPAINLINETVVVAPGSMVMRH